MWDWFSRLFATPVPLNPEEVYWSGYSREQAKRIRIYMESYREREKEERRIMAAEHEALCRSLRYGKTRFQWSGAR